MVIPAAPKGSGGEKSWFSPPPGAANVALRLSEITATESDKRTTTGIGEFDRVLGGGIVPGALILIGGDPGIGKSTLLTQAAGNLAAAGLRTLYVSGEESATQIKRRADRLGIHPTADLLLLAETDVTRIEGAIRDNQPQIVIVDSIQTTTPSGNQRACREAFGRCGRARRVLGRIAKTEGIAIFLVGHVTKEGTLAGPRVLEHMVDAVITFEGDRHSFYRLLRATKNRFGSTDELGIFEMHETGLTEVANPSELLLSERPEHAVGSAVTATVEGSRPLLIEVQALIAPSYLNNPRRSVTGIDANRVQMILAVLCEATAAWGQDVFINVAGGVRIVETAADLAVALAAASHWKDAPIDSTTIAIGELGLAGEVRAVGRIEQRLGEAYRLGFRRAIISRHHLRGTHYKPPPGLEVVGVDNIVQAIDVALEVLGHSEDGSCLRPRHLPMREGTELPATLHLA